MNKVVNAANAAFATAQFRELPSGDRQTRAAWQAVVWFLAMAMILAVPGCGGCRNDSKQKQKELADAAKKLKEKKKPPYETRRPVVVPGNYSVKKPDPNDPNQMVVDESPIKDNRAKLGHWTTFHYPVVSNLKDVDGRIDGVAVALRELAPVRFTDRALNTTRGISLPKGQWKNLETNDYIPRRDVHDATTATMRFSLHDRGSSVPIHSSDEPTSLLKDFQFHVVVLSQDLLALSYLKSLDCIIDAGEDSLLRGRPDAFYHLVPPTPDSPAALPRASLAWTTMAYVVWYDADPNDLDLEQQRALVDWLHWGGQLIISGPEALKVLENSFLADFLPASQQKPTNLSQSDIDPLNYWSVANLSDRQMIRVGESGKMLGVDLVANPDAAFIENGGNLVCERRLGRGRIVVTAFSIGSKEFAGWKSVSNFFHNVLLRRPKRRFFSDSIRTSFYFPEYNEQKLPSRVKDPLLGSALRYLSRDLYETDRALRRTKTMSPYYIARSTKEMDYQNMPGRRIELDDTLWYSRPSQSDTWRFGGYSNTPQSGVAGWNDFGAVSNAARETIKMAAGVTPPSAAFVLRLLLIYLAVLVPINWLFFRAIGKVEWAWAAAPIIAVVGAIVVTKTASLDIGFARSRSEISLVEIQGGYPRAHMTSYTALYTSLSTNYDLQFDDPYAQILPFAVSEDRKKRDQIKKINLVRSQQTVLDNFFIKSNSTGLLHSETMVDTGGPIELLKTADGKWQVHNGSDINLRDVGVISSSDERAISAAWIGDLTAGSESSPLNLQATNSAISTWEQSYRMTGSYRVSSYFDNEIARIKGNGVDSTVAEIRLQLTRLGVWDKLLEHAIDLKSRQIYLTDDEMSLTTSDLRTLKQTMMSQQTLNLGPLTSAVVNDLKFGDNEIRLVGWTNEPVSTSVTKPAATQEQRMTLVVVHLKHGDLPKIESDENCLLEVKDNIDD
ncbi:hypothetical protein N9242_03115 [Vicingaceae bacterium]|nr:hypothetical protein [Vicingaceae bacterium]